MAYFISGSSRISVTSRLHRTGLRVWGPQTGGKASNKAEDSLRVNITSRIRKRPPVFPSGPLTQSMRRIQWVTSSLEMTILFCRVDKVDITPGTVMSEWYNRFQPGHVHFSAFHSNIEFLRHVFVEDCNKETLQCKFDKSFPSNEKATTNLITEMKNAPSSDVSIRHHSRKNRMQFSFLRSHRPNHDRSRADLR